MVFSDCASASPIWAVESFSLLVTSAIFNCIFIDAGISSSSKLLKVIVDEFAEFAVIAEPSVANEIS